jgi:hypothetical protein
MVGLCADMEEMGRDVGDCTSIVVRHHGAQCAPPLRSERRRGGGADEVPSWCGGTLRVGEVENAGHGLQTERVVVHVHRCEGGRVRVLIRRPRGGRLECVKDL